MLFSSAVEVLVLEICVADILVRCGNVVDTLVAISSAVGSWVVDASPA